MIVLVIILALLLSLALSALFFLYYMWKRFEYDYGSRLGWSGSMFKKLWRRSR